ncbi:uncharacterized protein LOC123552298 [Mercenaria mercenaria]|uniref:uncharacterized protein LOC123552298 n=1 Tax=Mercenaria mercenaria TaxID=6596 RepID=UPI00234EDB72|nr:uncharacterized protein LOC123552298 [Mercenaria mercenaria]
MATSGFNMANMKLFENRKKRQKRLNGNKTKTQGSRERYKVVYKKEIQEENVEIVQIVKREEEGINDREGICSTSICAVSTTEESFVANIKLQLQIISGQSIRSIWAEDAVILHKTKKSAERTVATNSSTSTVSFRSQLEKECSLLPMTLLTFMSVLHYVQYCKPSYTTAPTKRSTHMTSTDNGSSLTHFHEALAVNGRRTAESTREEIHFTSYSSIKSDVCVVKPQMQITGFHEQPQITVTVPTSQTLSFQDTAIEVKLPTRDVCEPTRFTTKSGTTFKDDGGKLKRLRAFDRKKFVRLDNSVVEPPSPRRKRGYQKHIREYQKHIKEKRSEVHVHKKAAREKTLKSVSQKMFELQYIENVDDYIECKRAKYRLKEKELDTFLTKINGVDKLAYSQGEVPGKSMRITQKTEYITKLFKEIGLRRDNLNEDPKLNVSLMHNFIFDTDFSESGDVENCALDFENLVDFLSNDSVMSYFFRRYMEDIDSTGAYSINSLREARYFLGLKQINSDKVCMYFLQLQGKLEDKQNNEQQLKPRIRLITVPAEVFENAMRQCQIYEYELTFSNYFPRNCRMFIAIPVYKGGFINRRDNKDRR